jgi:serine/threonine protein kinase
MASEWERPQVMSSADQIDTLCDSFESLWRAGTRPEIAHYLDKVAVSDRPAFLRELLAIELDLRRGLGEHPCLTDELSRFPGLEDAVREVFAQARLVARPSDSSMHATVTLQPDTGRDTSLPIATTLPPQAGGSAGWTTTDGAGVGRAAGQSLGDYEILQEIARGGMGVVYKARQKKANRIVALKMILSGQLAGAEEVKRFYTEAEAAANLDHPNIVPVYDVGEVNGQHYFSMGYVDGPSLKQRVQQGPMPPREAAQLVKTIAEAVHYAHQKGVLHRDLKPANVLLARSGVVSGGVVSGEADKADRTTTHDSPLTTHQPKITDFGLAKRLHEESGQTHTGQVMGTPSYMPPEQAAGKIAELGPAADVYALGAILYELLTGRPPFQAASTLEVLTQVLEQEPATPRSLNARIPRDVETITLKCLAKEPAKRYGSAHELAEDLDRYLGSEPIVARPVSAVERVWRWSRRHPAVAGAIAAVVVGLLSVSALSVALWNTNSNLRRANRAEAAATHEAITKRKEAEDAVQVAHQQGIEAELQRKRAETNFRQSLNVVMPLLLKLHCNRIHETPTQRQTSDKLLADVGRFYARFVDSASTDPDSRTEASAALVHLGYLHRLRNDHDSTEKALRQAVALAEGLVQEEPDSRQARLSLAQRHDVLGKELYQTGQVQLAERSLEQSIKELHELLRRFPNDADLVQQTAYVLVSCPVPALRDPQRALGLAEQAMRAGPTPTREAILGMALHRAGQSHEAVHALERSVAAGEGDSVVWFFLSLAHAALGSQDHARTCYDQAVAWMQQHNMAADDLPILRAEAETAINSLMERADEQTKS